MVHWAKFTFQPKINGSWADPSLSCGCKCSNYISLVTSTAPAQNIKRCKHEKEKTFLQHMGKGRWVEDRMKKQSYTETTNANLIKRSRNQSPCLTMIEDASIETTVIPSQRL